MISRNNKTQPQPQTKTKTTASGGSSHGIRKSTCSIIFISSIAGTRVLHPQEQCAYNASKAGVAQLARSLAAEWAPHGIRVNTIAPGYMNTRLNDEANLEGVKQHWANMTPMGRMGEPHELNGLVVFLASEAAGFVTGAEIYVDVSCASIFFFSSFLNLVGWRDGTGLLLSNRFSLSATFLSILTSKTVFLLALFESVQVKMESWRSCKCCLVHTW